MPIYLYYICVSVFYYTKYHYGPLCQQSLSNKDAMSNGNQEKEDKKCEQKTEGCCV